MRELVRQVGGGLGEAVLAIVVAAVVAAVGLEAFSVVHWPAFNSSNVTRSITTVGQVVTIALLVGAVALIRLRRARRFAEVLTWVGISGFVTVTLGMPLAATKLYLLGISVDQEFRTEYLTRLTDTAALHDMTYAGLPPFYPAGWFWIGGRVANLLGVAGWEAFKPWAIMSLSIASVLAYVLWSKLIRADWAVAVAAVTTVVMVAYASPEAYSAVLVILFAPAMVLAWGALYRPELADDARPDTVETRSTTAETQSATAEVQPATADARPATADTRPATAGTQPATADIRPATAETRLATAEAQPATAAARSATAETHSATTETRSATTETQTATADTQSATAETRLATADSWPATVDARPPTADVRPATAEPRPTTAGGWGAVLGTGLFLGVSAMSYSLFFVVAVFAVVLMGLLAWLSLWWQQRTNPWRLLWPILIRLIGMGVLAGILALLVWAPYLAKALTGGRALSNTAFHYLPESGSQLPLPMFEFSLLGALCLVGTVWLVLRSVRSRRAQALGIAVVAIYLWSLLSMAVTVGGTTLLSFRLEPILQVLLAAAGVFGLAEGGRAIYRALNEPQRFRTVAVVVSVLAVLAFAQHIPNILSNEITTAYTDTDGNGERADKRSPSAVSWYRAVDAALLADTGRPRDQTVVLTADTSFLAYYPYFGFQALTSHYANPLADFAGRAREIGHWSSLKTPAELLDALAASPWRTPDAFVFRTSGDNYTLRLSEDVYPNDPNVRRYTVTFPKTLFDDPHFHSTVAGPFTVITVQR
ncbi:arabinofuranosyltransferase [Nocardia sp. BMG111209]|uniref:arabinofuranosyltransferase n=1 Tax=Nocardia sp. BMG111209 TaxID=1160137 RepID=UPI00036535D4|nr:arabinofuranosyltransferase [Nocardia sp. BMG111209]